MTTRVYLVRHGATVLSAEDRFAGSSDVELSAEGRRQAERLAARLSDDPLAAVYASPMRRTVDTASTLAKSHGIAVETRDGLREIDHGRWEGLRRADVEVRFAQEYAAWQADPYTFAPEGGESGLDVAARALPVVRTIVQAHEGASVVVVSHKATIRLVISALLGIDPRGYRDRLDQSPACLNAIEFKDPVRARLMLFNDVSHYIDCPPPPGPQLSSWWGAPGGG